MNIDKLSEHLQPRREPDRDHASCQRAYDSPRRREQAQATRADIAHAARRLFLDRGWAGTRVHDVAAEAGVAEPTVYAHYGSKAGLARALVDTVNLTAQVAFAPADILAAGDDPTAQLASMISTDRRLFERGGDIITLLHDAGRSEPALRDAYDEGRARADQIRRGVFDTWSTRWFRPGVHAARAADIYAATCNIGVYEILTTERAWTPPQVQTWWQDSLSHLLLEDPTINTGAP